MRARAALALVLLVALAAAVGACGSSQERNDYVKALNQAQTGLTQRFTSLQRRITPTSTPAQDARTLTAYERAVTATVGELRAVDPPTGFGTLHRQLVGEVSDYGTALRSARSQLRGTDPKKVLAAQARLRAAIARAGTRLNATIQAINTKIKG